MTALIYRKCLLPFAAPPAGRMDSRAGRRGGEVRPRATRQR